MVDFLFQNEITARESKALLKEFENYYHSSDPTIVDANTIDISITRAPAGSNTNFSLTATYNHSLISANLINAIMGTNTMDPILIFRSTVVMRGQ